MTAFGQEEEDEDQEDTDYGKTMRGSSPAREQMLQAGEVERLRPADLACITRERWRLRGWERQPC